MGSVWPSSSSSSYLIVGAGCFGSSAAYHLALTHPSAKITLIDRAAFPNPSAAAHDINKIIRADYPDIWYMRLALEAQDQWRLNSIYSPYYHETGMLFAEDFGMGRAALNNYRKLLGDECPAIMLEPDVARAKFKMFEDANWEGVKQNFYNPRSGWGEADKALESIIRAAIDKGVQFTVANVTKLAIDPYTGATTGVTTESGEVLEADNILLCAGAYTEKLLVDSAPHDKNLQANGRLVAAAAVSCYITVPPDRRQNFKDAPVMFNGLDHTHGEAIPLTSDGRIKFNFELSFTNKVLHEASGHTISVPPSRPSASIWSQDVPEQFKQETRTVMKHIYGNLVENLEPENYRMCWDAVTPNQDWIISPHPHSQNLYIASGGSFHSWKFLPNIGKYIVQMLDRTLHQELRDKWSWNRADEGAACEMYIPTRDLKDYV